MQVRVFRVEPTSNARSDDLPLKLQLILLMTFIFTAAALSFEYLYKQHIKNDIYQFQASLFAGGVVLYMALISFIQRLGGNVCMRLGIPDGRCTESLIKGAIMSGISSTLVGTSIVLLLKYRDGEVDLEKEYLKEKVMVITGALPVIMAYFYQ